MNANKAGFQCPFFVFFVPSFVIFVSSFKILIFICVHLCSSVDRFQVHHQHLLQQLRDVPEARVAGVLHEFEQHHFDVAQVDAGALHAAEADVAVEFAA